MASPARFVHATRVGMLFLILAFALPASVTAGGPGKHAGPWGPAVLEVGINSDQADGCPIESPNGLDLYFASTRPGAVGGPTDLNDIWVAHRTRVNRPWAAPVRLPEPVNSSAADFCPTPLNGGRLYFVSSRSIPGVSCGAGDICRTRMHRHRGWAEPENLGCVDAPRPGPNSAGNEFSPSIVSTRHRTLLYFSSTGPDGIGDQDIYVSKMRRDGTFGPGTLVPGLSTGANDQMPNVSRNGLEIVFASDRDGPAGAFDIYAATRRSTRDAWSAPVKLGPEVNTAAPETRPSLSGDLRRLHFGRLGDIWVSTRAIHNRGDHD